MDMKGAAIRELAMKRYIAITSLLCEIYSVPSGKLPSLHQLNYFKNYILGRSLNDIKIFLNERSNRIGSEPWYRKIYLQKSLVDMLLNEIIKELDGIHELDAFSTLWGESLFTFFDESELERIELVGRDKEKLLKSILTHFIDMLLLKQRDLPVYFDHQCKMRVANGTASD